MIQSTGSALTLRSHAVLSSLKPCSGMCPASAAMAHKAAVARPSFVP